MFMLTGIITIPMTMRRAAVMNLHFPWQSKQKIRLHENHLQDVAQKRATSREGGRTPCTGSNATLYLIQPSWLARGATLKSQANRLQVPC